MQTDETSASPTKLRILAAARICFAQSGFHGASMKKICKSSDISPGTLYHHFPGKEALIEAIILEDQIRAFSRLEQHNSDIVGSIVKSLLEIRKEHLAQRALVIEIMAEGMRNAQVAAMLERKHDAIIAATQSRLFEAQQQGQIGKDVNLPSAVTLLLALTYGILVDPTTSIEISDEQRTKVFTDMLCGALHSPTEY